MPAMSVLWGLLAINLICFVLFGWDKVCAGRHWWRVPERRLLLVAMLGGSVGAKAGQVVFRHKTRKEAFRTRLNLILAAHLALVGALAVWRL